MILGPRCLEGVRGLGAPGGRFALWQAKWHHNKKETFSEKLAVLCEKLGREKEKLSQAGSESSAAEVEVLLAAVREQLFAFACIRNVRSAIWTKDLRSRQQKEKKVELANGLTQLLSLADSGENSFPRGDSGKSYLEAECRERLERHNKGPQHRGSWAQAAAAPAAAPPAAAQPAEAPLAAAGGPGGPAPAQAAGEPPAAGADSAGAGTPTPTGGRSPSSWHG